MEGRRKSPFLSFLHVFVLQLVDGHCQLEGDCIQNPVVNEVAMRLEDRRRLQLPLSKGIAWGACCPSAARVSGDFRQD